MDNYEFFYRVPGQVANTVKRLSDGAFIPFDSRNSDCAQFLIDWKAGATVTNADGTPAAYSDAAVIALGLEPPAG